MNLVYTEFLNININEKFFDSLRTDYKEFDKWFLKKQNEKAYIFRENSELQGFLYLKIENSEVNDVEPKLPANKRLKIGTMKIDAHGTRLGERFLKKAIDYAVREKVNEIYVTVFPKHKALILLFEEYGFEKVGVKKTSNGEELVLLKSFSKLKNNLLLDYPIINAKKNRKYLLSIYPKWHTELFPDSILNTESIDIIEDISHTNSIHKIYLTSMKIGSVKRGDIIVIYRTKDDNGPAWYRSVATSICVVEDVKLSRTFTIQKFLELGAKYSVFDEQELRKWHAREGSFVITMTYNAAMSKRLTMQTLVEKIGLDKEEYWGFRELTDNQFKSIVKLGGINEDFIVY
ncbi:N-acetyltransferase family protein (plasmid) [Leptospira sp. WS60.C2]